MMELKGGVHFSSGRGDACASRSMVKVSSELAGGK